MSSTHSPDSGEEYGGDPSNNAFLQAPWQPEPEPPTEQEGYEPEEDDYEDDEGYELTPYDVVDRFLGAPDEEDLAEREQLQAQEDLADGTAVRQIAEEQAELSELAWDMVEKLPGIDSPEFVEEATPILEAIGQEYDFESTEDELALLAQVYEELGGVERWGPDAEAEAWARATFVPSGNLFTT